MFCQHLWAAELKSSHKKDELLAGANYEKRFKNKLIGLTHEMAQMLIPPNPPPGGNLKGPREGVGGIDASRTGL